MREILFRGKRMNDGGWVYGDYHRYTCTTSSIIPTPTHYIMGRDASSKANIWVDPTTVGQYTGLPDKNGVKIFEGDIVAWRDKNFILNSHYAYGFDGYKYGDELIVRCLKSGFMLCKKHDGIPDIPNANAKIDNYAFWNFHRFLEVIGNIYDNPELLEEASNAPTD